MNVVKFSVTHNFSPNYSKTFLSDPDFNCEKVTGKIYNVHYDKLQCIIYVDGQKITGKISNDTYIGIMKHKRKIAQYDTNLFAGGVFVIYEDKTAELISFFSGMTGFNSLYGIIE